MHVYETNNAGQICTKGQRTSWHVEDLIDTSRTARARSRSGNAQSRLPVSWAPESIFAQKQLMNPANACSYKAG
jgi:hypothetical protein